MNTNRLKKAWVLLDEYNDLRHMAIFRKKLEEQLRNANIPLTHVPWKSMIQATLCRNLFQDEQLGEMRSNIVECYTEDDIKASKVMIDLVLKNDTNDPENLTETWFEIEELKQRFQRAFDTLPKSRRERREMTRRILGYPSSEMNVEDEINVQSEEEGGGDLTPVLNDDEQRAMRTGDLIELSGNRLHDAFYVYRLPQKGIWSQIKQMWSKHQITNFVFQENQTDEEIILIPAMDEYGYGVPYLFATTPNQLLSDGALYKYVDINCPYISSQIQNPTIALVQKHLNERLQNPVYQDKYIGEERTIDLARFPQEYVAMVHINDCEKDNVVWVQRIHYNRREISRDLNDNFDIFISRRILEAEDQYRKKMNFL